MLQVYSQSTSQQIKHDRWDIIDLWMPNPPAKEKVPNGFVTQVYWYKMSGNPPQLQYFLCFSLLSYNLLVVGLFFPRLPSEVGGFPVLLVQPTEKLYSCGIQFVYCSLTFKNTGIYYNAVYRFFTCVTTAYIIVKQCN